MDANPQTNDRSDTQSLATPPIPDAVPTPWVERPATWRLLGVLTVGAMFVLVASVNRPQSSRASEPALAPIGRAFPIGGHLGPAQAPLIRPGFKSLGQLEGASHRVLVFSTPEGVRYSVATLAGAAIADNLTLEQITQQFPDIELDRLRDLPADDTQSTRPTGPLMLAEPTTDAR